MCACDLFGQMLQWSNLKKKENKKNIYLYNIIIDEQTQKETENLHGIQAFHNSFQPITSIDILELNAKSIFTYICGLSPTLLLYLL